MRDEAILSPHSCRNGGHNNVNASKTRLKWYSNRFDNISPETFKYSEEVMLYTQILQYRWRQSVSGPPYIIHLVAEGKKRFDYVSHIFHIGWISKLHLTFFEKFTILLAARPDIRSSKYIYTYPFFTSDTELVSLTSCIHPLCFSVIRPIVKTVKMAKTVKRTKLGYCFLAYILLC